MPNTTIILHFKTCDKIVFKKKISTAEIDLWKKDFLSNLMT